ncbi:adenosylcobinamide-GDP ribazoletransferase [Vibrio methylphosphonaticus]|uniref:adenosylcobinamide-GDP ribazoletransferase n=1 Tax=Vibrio methylphosphonaticus TaxID=2946866 RepID=UPI00202A552F|nr:adenosylcobinamide-GDP ribazoletransferase [Vibrio methylphosphonaticus]MCL9774794.1 adenosylcobinamide-GDP ribazoletransferase [Vibrio methylphosphonaticus]
MLQWQLFCLALSFFSRLPVPASMPYSTERMNRSGRYFALVGLLLGVICAIAFQLLNMLLPPSVSVVMTMVVSLLLTGAFHEDGLADMADGIGGGMTLDKRLTIMKDSRLGTYGAATLMMGLLLKYVVLVELTTMTFMFAVWVVGYTTSRAVAASFISTMPYVSDPEGSKSKPLANTQRPSELLFLTCCGVLPALFIGVDFTVMVIAVAVMFHFLFRRWLLLRIGGYTGDCLGAAQQIMELLIYLCLLVMLG